MRKLLATFVLAGGLTGFANTANADGVDYGKWLCTNCDLNQYAARFGTPNQSLTNFGEAMQFISSVVNVYVNVWRPNDLIRICDGRLCVSARWTGSPTATWVYQYTEPDRGRPYKNGDGHTITSWFGGNWYEGFGDYGYGWYEPYRPYYAFGDPFAGGTITVIVTPITPVFILSGMYSYGLPPPPSGGGCGGSRPGEGCPILQ